MKEKREIKRAGVLGAGVMGAQIAAHLASAGIEVCLLDIVPPQLSEDDKKKGITTQDKSFRNRFAQKGLDAQVKAKQSGFMSKADAERVRVGNFEDNMKWLKDCDFIIEAVVERLDIKQKVFKEVSKYWNGNAIVASNTSGIRLKEIATALSPELQKFFLGIHFFNPVRFMHLCEVIPWAKTKKEISIKKNDIVEIISGPFKRENAKVTRIDKLKEEVVVELLGSAVPIPITLKLDAVKVIRREGEEAKEED